MKLDLIIFLLQRKLRQYREIVRSILVKNSSKDINSPDNHIYKQNRIKLIQKEYKFDMFIETGTFYGQMVYSTRNLFSQICSIEIFKKLADLNTRSFANNKHINIICGDSSTVLLKIMENDKPQSVLFWLDGHYSGLGTGCGEKITPIITEIRTILKHKPKKYSIIIDDWRLFNGTDYPSKEELLNEFSAVKKHIEISTDSDALVIKSILR